MRTLRTSAWLPAAAVLFGTGWGANQFSPMLLVYRRTLGLGTGALEALFGVYALGLIPGLLLAGPLSDARGRRPVVIPAAWLSLASGLTLAAGAHHPAALVAGRLMAGVTSGVVFGAGTAWLRELSRPPFGSAPDHAPARCAAVAMTAGFALGPLVAGMVAQWAPAPAVIAYAPHVVLMTGVLVLLRGVPETVAASGRRPTLVPAGLGSHRFRRVVAPMAPWAFAAPAVAFALLPSVVGAARHTDGIALTAGITALCALSGVLVQPFARRLDAAGRPVSTAGLAGDVWMLAPSAIALGAAYGLCLVAGLVEVQRLADPRSLAGLTAVFYALTYLGFAAPYALALATTAAGYPTLLAATAALALATAVVVEGSGRRKPA